MKLFIAMGISLFSTVVIAQNLPYSMSKIQANYECMSEGTGIALLLTEQGQVVKVWQADSGASTGLELRLTQTKNGNCSGCFAFEGKLSDQVLVFAEINHHNLVYKIQDLETGSEFVALETQCKTK